MELRTDATERSSALSRSRLMLAKPLPFDAPQAATEEVWEERKGAGEDGYGERAQKDDRVGTRLDHERK